MVEKTTTFLAADFQKRDVVKTKNGGNYEVLSVTNKGKVRCKSLNLPERVVDLKPENLTIIRPSNLRPAQQ